HLLGQIIPHPRFVARNRQIRRAQQLLFAVAQRVANSLLHLRIGSPTLSRRFTRHQFQNPITLLQLQRGTHLPRLHSHHHFLERRVRLVQRRLRHIPQISARRRRVHVLGIIHRQLRKIRAAVQSVHQHFYFALRFRFVRC